MRIALVCPYAWDLPGGVQVHVRELAEHLRLRDHHTLVLAPSVGAIRESGVAVVGRAVRVRYQGTVAPISFAPAALGRVRRALRRFRPDVVHLHEPFAPSTTLFAALVATAPLVATFHAYTARSGLYSAAAPALRPLWRRLRVRIAVSEAAAEYVRRRFGDGLRIVPNGCDVDRFARGMPLPGLPGGRRMLWVGRLDPQKGFAVALAAFARLAGDLPGLWFVVVGEGRNRALAEALPEDVRGRVHLAGSVLHERLPPYHAAADVFVAPATGQESFGLVLVEAMAAGVPVVASDIPGYREVVRDGVDGILVPPNDPDALAEAVRRILTDADLADRLRRDGRARAERFRWEAVAEQVEAAYRDAVSAGSRRRPRGTPGC